MSCHCQNVLCHIFKCFSYIYIYIHGMDWLGADLENSSSFPLYALEIKCYAVF